LAERAVWPMAVVVLGVLGQHGCGVPLIEDEDAVEEIGGRYRRSVQRSRWPAAPAPVP
jgi:hypothetical protein